RAGAKGRNVCALGNRAGLLLRCRHPACAQLRTATGDPVFQRRLRFLDKPRRTGSPACAEDDSCERGRTPANPLARLARSVSTAGSDALKTKTAKTTPCTVAGALISLLKSPLRI